MGVLSGHIIQGYSSSFGRKGGTSIAFITLKERCLPLILFDFWNGVSFVGREKNP